MPKQTLQLDKYARDAKTWWIYAQANYDGARVLFTHEERNLTLCFPAAMLGHHALEAFLKTALICEGITIFDSLKLGRLDPPTSLQEEDCAWGHHLGELAKKLAKRRPDFDLSKVLPGRYFFPRAEPITIQSGLALFDPYFWELRYPQAMKELDSIGPQDVLLLDALVAELLPFVEKAK